MTRFRRSCPVFPRVLHRADDLSSRVGRPIYRDVDDRIFRTPHRAPLPARKIRIPDSRVPGEPTPPYEREWPRFLVTGFVVAPPYSAKVSSLLTSCRWAKRVPETGGTTTALGIHPRAAPPRACVSRRVLGAKPRHRWRGRGRDREGRVQSNALRFAVQKIWDAPYEIDY